MRALIRTVALGVVLSATASVAGEGLAPRTHVVTIEGMRFEPNELTVARGDTIEWVNKDVVPHTASSNAGGFDSGMIATGRSWRLTVKDAGDFAYICTYHPAMKAMLHVTEERTGG